jgi:hypothetical protein
VAERAYFGVAVARVQLARLDQVAARVQTQRGYLVVTGVRFQLVEQPRAESAPTGSGHDEHAGDLADPAGQQAQAGAAEHGVVLDRHQQQAAGPGQVVARFLPHGRRDLLVGGRAAVVPAGDLGEVGPQDLARRGGRRRHDRDDRVGIPHPSSIASAATTHHARPGVKGPLPPSDASARGVKGPLPPPIGVKGPFTPLPGGPPV